jgi:hypothetical protein
MTSDAASKRRSERVVKESNAGPYGPAYPRRDN